MGEEVQSLSCRLELEMVEGGLFNIRCCSNNKYWMRETEDSPYIVSAAAKPNGDQSQWSCTLFVPIYADKDKDPNTIQLRCVYSQKFLSLSREACPRELSLKEGDNTGVGAEFTIIDRESLVVLPNLVAFSGSSLARYIGSTVGSYVTVTYIEIGNVVVATEIINNPDGSVLIKSKNSGQFWGRIPAANYVSAAWDYDEKNTNLFFRPVKVGKNTIALRNLGNNLFCRSLSGYLVADSPTITADATLTVEEPVLSRDIYNVIFHPENARIYNETVEELDAVECHNETEVPNTTTLKVTYTGTKLQTWGPIPSAKVTASTIMKTRIPFIAEGKIKFSAQVEGTWKWGDTQDESKFVESSYTATVPEMATLQVTLVATNGSCDVPFSYTQRDILFNGDVVIQQMDDGLFTGINSYNFKYNSVTI